MIVFLQTKNNERSNFLLFIVFVSVLQVDFEEVLAREQLVKDVGRGLKSTKLVNAS